jgi:hypothetical protein
VCRNATLPGVSICRTAVPLMRQVSGRIDLAHQRRTRCRRPHSSGRCLACSLDTLDKALALASGAPFALAVGVFTRDFARARRFAREIDAGQVQIHEYFPGGIEMQFGGNLQSGCGREQGFEAMRSYCKIKCVATRP